ncbi:MAG: polymer-forming cytoskeletal protein [Planctomycetota bacterium JB042]
MAEHQSTTETVIGADTVIKGDMTVESRARILGRFEGTIRAKGEIQVADKAQCSASVEAGVVHVDGALEGNITAAEKAALNATARVKGDLVAPKLVVTEGAAFQGHVSVGPDAMKNRPGGGASGGGGGGGGGQGGGQTEQQRSGKK